MPDPDSTPGNGLANGEDDIAAASIPVTNAPPIARPDRLTVQQGRALTLPAFGLTLLANDSDPDGDVIRVVGASAGSHGSMTQITDGPLIYTPRAGVFFRGQFFPGFVGTDSFFYIITDGDRTAQATVTVDVVNTAPSATPDAYSVKAGHSLTVAAGGVLANDVDPDGDVLQVVSVAQPTHGAVTLARDGGFVYTPNAGFIGTDTFDYTFTDGAATATSTVTIAVEPVAVVTGWSATDAGTAPEGNGPGPAGTLTFVITRTGDLSLASTATFSVEGGAGGTTSDDVALITAGGTDLGAGFGTYTASFAAGQASATIAIRAAGDGVPEADEGVVLTLLATSEGTLVQPDARIAAGRFLNDDALPSVSITAFTNAVEGNVSPAEDGILTFTLTRTGDLSRLMEVDYRISGFGPNPADGQIQFPAPGVIPPPADVQVFTDLYYAILFDRGEASRVISIRVNADTAFEADEQLQVTVFDALMFVDGVNPPGSATIGPNGSVVLTVFNDDAPTSDISLDSRILVGGEIVGVDEFGSPAGSTYTLRLTAANAAGAGIPADARVRITFPDYAIDVRGLLPEDADVVVDDVSATGCARSGGKWGPSVPALRSTSISS